MEERSFVWCTLDLPLKDKHRIEQHRDKPKLITEIFVLDDHTSSYCVRPKYVPVRIILVVFIFVLIQVLQPHFP